jgi:hypothetical protein
MHQSMLTLLCTALVQVNTHMPSLDGASPGPVRGNSSSSSAAAAAVAPANVYTDGGSSSSSSSQLYIPEAPTAPPTAFVSPDPYVPPADMHSASSTKGSSSTLPSVRNDGK